MSTEFGNLSTIAKLGLCENGQWYTTPVNLQVLAIEVQEKVPIRYSLTLTDGVGTISATAIGAVAESIEKGDIVATSVITASMYMCNIQDDGKRYVSLSFSVNKSIFLFVLLLLGFSLYIQ